MSKITLHQGDCLEYLRTLEPGSVDAVVTDPPYGIVNKFGIQDRGPGKGKRTLEWSWDKFDIVCEALTICFNALHDQSSLFVFCCIDNARNIQDVMRSSQITPKPYAWVKQFPVPPMKGNWWPSAFEIAIYGYRSGAWFGDTNPKRHNVFVCDSLRHGNKEKAGHPTQKPLKLMMHIVSSICPPGGTILDPFMGSGTTGVACVRTGRNFIGCEIDPGYFAIAQRRIADEQAKLALLEPCQA